MKLTEGNTTTYFPNKYFNQIGTTGTTTKHIFAGDILVATIEKVGSATSTVHYIHTDHLGSINVTTNSFGGISLVKDYLPFGATRIEEGNTSLKRGYIGQFEDGNDLIYLNARFQNPEQGRFLSQDPVFWGNPNVQNLTNPQSLNSYSYANGNPITNKDADGRSAGTFAQGVGTGLILAGATVAIIASAPIAVPATAMSTIAYIGLVGIGYGTYSNYQAYSSGSISKDQFDYNAGSLLGGLLFPSKIGGGKTTELSVNATEGHYSGLKDSSFVGPGKDFTATQKSNIYQQNLQNNGGVLKSDLSGKVLVLPQKSMRGVTPSQYEAQIDHIMAKNPSTPSVLKGTNSYSNAQVLSREENRIKSNK